ncbi:prephenate dehydratase [bacterium]|nr:prephenate dehydratase [bacterium]
MNFLSGVIRIAYLGPGGSYCEMAKDEFLDKYDIYPAEEPLNMISRVVDFVDENPGTVGVIPLENSIEGAVRESSDSIVKTKNPNIRILSEIVIPIHHCLLSKVTEIYSISGVISHPQALAQCHKFISENLPRNLAIVKATSTADAARSLDGYNLTYSAIGSKKTAQLYNLNILCENINDDPTNQTRFALIGDYDTPVTGNDKTSIAFSTENKSGALLEILEIFSKYNINLSYIDSRPSKTKFGEYTFYVDFDGHIKEDMIKNAVDEIQSKASFFRFVGSYEKYRAKDL